jgi:hypothetical protein
LKPPIPVGAHPAVSPGLYGCIVVFHPLSPS